MAAGIFLGSACTPRRSSCTRRAGPRLHAGAGSDEIVRFGPDRAVVAHGEAPFPILRHAAVIAESSSSHPCCHPTRA